MKIKVITLENKAAGDIEVADSIFTSEVRKDILHRAVTWQRAKAQAGTHKTKTVSEISGRHKKPFRQKGTGNARQGSTRSAQMRGGSTIFGPVVRSHAFSLPKKVRKMALRVALSAKYSDGSLFVVENIDIKQPKAKSVADIIAKNGWDAPLFIGGDNLNENFVKAARNIKHVDVLPQQGANVYDILRHRQVILTKDAVKCLEERLK
ncbi:MAG: 50S ribosomal protein L4 [Rickettsiales bacterium]